MPQDTRIALYLRLFREHAALVAWILNRHLRMVGLTDDVPDHVQEVFLKGLRSFQPSDEVKFRPWLSRMATNHAIDQLRKNAVRAKYVSEIDVGPLVEYVAARMPSPMELLLEEEKSTLLIDWLLTAYGRLPAPQREALHLRFFEGRGFPEIAQQLGIAENTAKSRIRYALSKLKRALTEAEALSDLPPSRRLQAA